jgi:hypothetical protein
VALATPDQLARVFDLDLWKADQPGLDEQFDADRFGVWLEVLLDAGATVAADKLAEMDVDLVMTGLAQHVRVFDSAAVRPYTTTDGVEMPALRALDDGLTEEVGGYVLLARRSEWWDAIVGVLMALDEAHAVFFQQLMRGCVEMSHAGREIDGLDDLIEDREQGMLDLAFERERRRERQGYITPAQARAFLQMARELETGPGAKPATNPVSRAYFRAIEETEPDELPAPDQEAAQAEGPSDPENQEETGGIADVMGILNSAGLLPQQPRALLGGSQHASSRLERVQQHLQFVLETDSAAYATRSAELTYLANTIMAGCSIQARPFTPQEASDAAIATCNLGLENWPAQWLHAPDRKARDRGTGSSLPVDFLAGHDLVSVFQVGWTLLYNDVSMYAAGHLIGVLARLRYADGATQAGLDDLRIVMLKHWQAGAPWRARDAMDVLAILDTPAWAALLGLIDECPVMHAAIDATRDRTARTIAGSRFEFISENRQIGTIHDFLQSLEETLRG